ncbi:MAG TPA: hypothetical protein QGF58_30855 [Myxococcota bacterium]|nr:hypothetical protein [Myxococcota bacterium]
MWAWGARALPAPVPSGPTLAHVLRHASGNGWFRRSWSTWGYQAFARPWVKPTETATGISCTYWGLATWKATTGLARSPVSTGMSRTLVSERAFEGPVVWK